MGIVEYLYALAGPLNANASELLDQPRVSRVEVVWSACNPDTRIVSLEALQYATTSQGVPAYALDMIHVYRFNKRRRICGFSLTSKRQGMAMAPLFPKPDDVESIAAYTASICGGIQTICGGPYKQFDSFEACMAFMATIPFGNPDYFDQNNVVCRALHLQLAIVDPAEHCWHTGARGGGKCVDHGVETLFAVKDYLSCE